MSETIVGILGFLTIAAIVVTLFKSKTLPSIAFIVFPTILAVILVIGGYYDFEQRNIILDSIRVATLDDDHNLKEVIPFDIQVAGENGFRVRPCFSKGKFLIMYEYVMET